MALVGKRSPLTSRGGVVALLERGLARVESSSLCGSTLSLGLAPRVLLTGGQREQHSDDKN